MCRGRVFNHTQVTFCSMTGSFKEPGRAGKARGGRVREQEVPYPRIFLDRALRMIWCSFRRLLRSASTPAFCSHRGDLGCRVFQVKKKNIFLNLSPLYPWYIVFPVKRGGAGEVNISVPPGRVYYVCNNVGFRLVFGGRVLDSRMDLIVRAVHASTSTCRLYTTTTISLGGMGIHKGTHTNTHSRPSTVALQTSAGASQNGVVSPSQPVVSSVKDEAAETLRKREKRLRKHAAKP